MNGSLSYFVTTFCYGDKYEPILPAWKNTISTICKKSIIEVFRNCNINLTNGYQYAWWDVVRMKNNIDILIKQNKPVVHIDIDIIIKKDIQPLIDLNYDLIFSKEIGEDGAYPKECSKILGFGICSGFYIIKPSGLNFMIKILKQMLSYKYNNYSDQVNIMNYIVNNNYIIKEEEIILDGVKYINKIIEIDNIKICVLDFNIIVRDPILNINQFGNHINIDNVGGTKNFLRYFEENLEDLPLTCRCGKTHLGDYNICKHIQLRKNVN
jgi:hypothetical protein